MTSTEGSFRARRTSGVEGPRLMSGGVGRGDGMTFVILLLSKACLFGVKVGGAGRARRAP